MCSASSSENLAPVHHQLVERRHAIADALLAGYEPEVARGEQSLQLARPVDDDQRADPGLLHHPGGVCHSVGRRHGIGIGNDAVLRALDDFDLAHLRGDIAAAEAAIDDAQAPFFGLDDGHGGPRNRVHVRRHDRMLQRDVLGEPRGEIDGLRIAALEHAESRREQEVVERATPDRVQQLRHAVIIA